MTDTPVLTAHQTAVAQAVAGTAPIFPWTPAHTLAMRCILWAHLPTAVLAGEICTAVLALGHSYCIPNVMSAAYTLPPEGEATVTLHRVGLAGAP